MGGISFWQIMIVVLLVVLLFGRGKISDLMGDVAKGIKSFKKGMADDDDVAANSSGKTIDHDGPAVQSTRDQTEKTNA